MTSSLATLKTDRSTSFTFGPSSSSSSTSGSFTMSPTSPQIRSRSGLSINSGASIPSSSSDDGSQSSDGSASGPEIKDETEEIVPVFSSIPTRRAKSSTAISRPFGSHMSPNSSDSGATVPPRRTPSFPLSKAIRPFDSISNAMGTNNKRVTPPMSRVEASTAIKDEKSFGAKVEPQLLEVQPTKPKRSNKLIAPPKSSRFQNGFFILDMTQEEFKSRAW